MFATPYRQDSTAMMLEQTASPVSERVALITGAGSGIGAALAMQLARQGIALALHGRGDSKDSLERVRQVESECLRLGAPQCLRLSAELGVESGAEQVVAATLARFGRLDLLVANAGYARGGGIAQSSWSSMQQAFAVMPLTFASMLRHALPALGAAPAARVVAVTSFVADRFDGCAPFLETAAAKAALEAVARSAAAELAPRGITVNCVAPGFTKKDRPSANQAAWQHAAEVTPLGHVARPEDVAAAICFLLSPQAGHITGSVLRVDGGLTLL